MIGLGWLAENGNAGSGHGGSSYQSVFGDLLYRQPGLSVKFFPPGFSRIYWLGGRAIARRIGKGAQLMKQIVAGIVAHVDAGKTTLSEALLYRTGEIRKLGRVDHGDAFLDTNSLEKARGITIFAHQAWWNTATCA